MCKMIQSTVLLLDIPGQNLFSCLSWMPEAIYLLCLMVPMCTWVTLFQLIHDFIQISSYITWAFPEHVVYIRTPCHSLTVRVHLHRT